MKITSLDDKRKRKAMGEMIVLPVFESIRVNDDGELVGKLVDYEEIPKYYLMNEGD